MMNAPLDGGAFRRCQKIEDDRHGVGRASLNPSDTSASSPAPLTAILIPPTLQPRRKYNSKYLVQFGDEIIASGRDAELDACRWLVRHGYRGQLRIVDSQTGKHRSTINIEKAARLTVKEGPHGPYFAKWEPSERLIVKGGKQ